MATLPDRPDLGQLRRQAKELHRAAVAGEPEAARRVGAVSDRPTLAAAQLAVARQHGFASWPSMKMAVEASRAAAPGPLMVDKHRQPAVRGAGDTLARARAEGWDAGTVPVGAVFTAQTFITRHLADRPDRYLPSESLTPANGSVFVTVDGPPVAVACLGPGAPAAVIVLEHLVGLGARSFAAVGPAPAIATDLGRGDCVVIDRALRDDGVSAHYAAPARYASADTSLTARLVVAAEERDLSPRTGSSWTVPTPFRTTADELAAYRSDGVAVTELVTAALFTVAGALGARAGAAVVVTSSLADPSPGQPPRPWGEEVFRLLEAAVDAVGADGMAS